MAQIYKRSGKWSVRIQWKDTEGKRFSKSKAGFATKALAKKWAAEMETNLNRGIHIEKKLLLVIITKNGLILISNLKYQV